MRKKPTPSEEDNQLLQAMNAHPQLKERIRAILELAEQPEGPLRSVDEIEELLVEEVRKLGSQTLADWARSAHERVEKEIKTRQPGTHRNKKNG